ncbi:MAG TPA: hypothetical protein VF894_00880 [Anaeromyxobacter sp.]
MMPLRLLAAIAAAALGALGAGLVAPRLHAAFGSPAPVSVLRAHASGGPLAPAPFVPPMRPSVPAGILARAADARALERGPSCPPPTPTASAREACGTEEREAIEIEWHVDREP